MRRKDQTRETNTAEIRKGIYIDFEGFADKPPSLLGILVEDRFEQVVFDESLRPAAEAKTIRQSTLHDEGRCLLSMCRRQGRCLFAFTRHELNVFEEYTDLGNQVELVYRDAHKIAKRWFNHHHTGDPPVDRSLSGFLRAIGVAPPAYIGSHKTTKRLRYVSDMLEKKGSYADVKGAARRHWTNLLKHNELDCRLMRDLMLRVAKDL